MGSIVSVSQFYANGALRCEAQVTLSSGKTKFIGFPIEAGHDDAALRKLAQVEVDDIEAILNAR